VSNQPGKAIAGLRLRAEYLALTVNNIHGFADEWTWATSIGGDEDKTLELDDYFRAKGLIDYFHNDGIIGWAVYPSRVDYADGTTWTPRDRGECFAVSWRDRVYPRLEFLPPLAPALEIPEDYKRPPRRLRQ